MARKLYKNLCRDERIVECAVMIELKAEVIGDGVELIIREPKNLLRKGERIVEPVLEAV